MAQPPPNDAESTDDEDCTKDDPTPPPRSHPVWHNVVAGGFSGFGSRMVTAPLDLIRIRRQLTRTTMTYPRESMLGSWRNIVKNEGGVKALYRGNTAAIYLWVGYSAVQFTLYKKTRETLVTVCNFPASAAAFGGGAVAGVCATMATYPFDVCRTTFAARGMVETSSASEPVVSPETASQKQPAAPPPRPRKQPMPFSSLVEPGYLQHELHPLHESSKSIDSHHQQQQKRKFSSTPSSAAEPAKALRPPTTFSEFCIQLYQQKGIRGFYAGSGPAVIQIIPYMGLNFTFYDYLTSGDRGVALSGYAGAISGATSKIIVYPCDTIKRRLQAQAFFDASSSSSAATLDAGIGGVESRYYTGMWDCMQSIARHEGLASFYRGMVPSVLKTAIASSLAFSLFRFSKNMLETIDDHYRDLYVIGEDETTSSPGRVDR